MTPIRSAATDPMTDRSAPASPLSAIPPVTASGRLRAENRIRTKAITVPRPDTTTMRRRSRASQSASATRTTASAISATTMMSNALTTVCAAVSRSAGISWIVPKSGGRVTPSADCSRAASAAGASSVVRSGSVTFGRDDPDRLQLLEDLPDHGKDIELDVAVRNRDRIDLAAQAARPHARG